MNQNFKLRLDHGGTNRVKLGRKLGQGCCLSPILFNLYSSYFTKESIKGFTDVKV